MTTTMTDGPPEAPGKRVNLRRAGRVVLVLFVIFDLYVIMWLSVHAAYHRGKVDECRAIEASYPGFCSTQR